MWTAVCVLFVLIFGYITMLLWNWIVPSIFDVRPITFWQALGLLLLSKIFFGGFGGHRCGGGHGNTLWKNRYYDKLSGMTPEDRERFKSRMKQKWCSRDQSTSAGNSHTSID